MRTVAINLAVFVVLLLGIEIFLRVSEWSPPVAFSGVHYENDRLAGPWARTSQVTFHDMPCHNSRDIHFNSLGMRDIERASQPAPGKTRVAFVGDSMLQGLQVKDEETVTRQIEALDPAIEALNFGVSSVGTSVELLSYHLRVKPLKPNAVVVLFATANDLEDNHPVLKAKMDPVMGQISSYFLLGPDGKLQEEPKPGAERGTSLTQRALGLTRTGQVVYKAYSLFRRPKAATAVKAELTDQEKAVREEAWSITEQVLERFHREVSADGARFALVVLPDMREIDPQGQFGERTRIAIERLTALGQRAGFPVHAIAQTFSDAASKSGSTDFTYGCDTTHWNPKGHRLAAEAIRDALASAGVVAARN